MTGAGSRAVETIENTRAAKVAARRGIRARISPEGNPARRRKFGLVAGKGDPLRGLAIVRRVDDDRCATGRCSIFMMGPAAARWARDSTTTKLTIANSKTARRFMADSFAQKPTSTTGLDYIRVAVRGLHQTPHDRRLLVAKRPSKTNVGVMRGAKRANIVARGQLSSLVRA